MKPPTWDELPPITQNEFLLEGKIGLENWYFDNSKDPRTSFSKEHIDRLIESAKKRIQGESYGATDTWLYSCLDEYPIKGKSVAVMGSTIPWYEAIVLAFEGIPTTIDYNLTDYHHPGIKQMTLEEYRKNPIKFDVAISISSFEHDGLGRYGDPINPNGDLKAMQEMKTIVKEGGELFLAVPMGLDKVVWNAHRVYGNTRFPLLIEGWEPVGSEGYDEYALSSNMGVSGVYQPVIVLKNT